MLCFVAVIGIFTVLLFGTAPALRASATSPDTALKAGSAKQSSRIGMLRPLLTVQVGFSTAVLFIAGLLILSFHKLTSVDLGFARNGIVLFSIEAKSLKDGEKARIAGLQLLDTIRQIPSVQQASLSGTALLGGPYAWVMTPGIQIPGRPPEGNGPNFLEVSPGFFNTMQIGFIEGRDIAPRDTEPQFPSAVVVNRAFADRYFPGESPIGRQFQKAVGEQARMVTQQIIGLVANAKYNNIREEVRPTIYGPLREVSDRTLEVRIAGDALSLIPMLRKEIENTNSALHVNSVTLQSTRIENTLFAERLLALLSVFFAVVALVIAAVGFYGVISYSIVRRTKEIGIRVALGARRAGVVRLVLSDIVLVTMIGLLAGATGGFMLSRFVASMLFEVKPTDVWSIALPLTCLFLANALAAIPPVLRAARVDPIVALRYE
jgi:predicted permease